MPTPVFIIGKGRSGTTWLASKLSTHPDIAAVLRNDQDIKESRYFIYMVGRYGDLRVKSNFVEFVEVASATDYFKLAGIDNEFLYSLPSRNYEEIFRNVMDECAKRQGASHWIEKTPSHTRELFSIAKAYPDAKFIGVTRDVHAVTASTLEFFNNATFAVLWPKSRKLQILRSVVEWVFYKKVITSFVRRSDRMLLIKYEDFVGDPEATLRSVCSFIGVEYYASMSQQAYRPNTSFASSNHRKRALTNGDRRLISVVATLFNFVPSWAYRLGIKVWEKSRGRASLPPSYFRLVNTSNAPTTVGVEAGSERTSY